MILDSKDPFNLGLTAPKRWGQFQAAVNCLPADKEEREQVLETAKVVCQINPASPAEIAETVQTVGILYPDYRLASPEERDTIAEAFQDSFLGVDLDVFNGGLLWYSESPAKFFCSPGQLWALLEPILAARAYWRIEAGRIASKIEPGLTLVGGNDG